MPSFSLARPLFARQDDTPRDFLERCLSSIDKYESKIRAFAHIDISEARLLANASSQRWRNGTQLSEIDGMPVGVKDTIETSNMPTQCGSPYFDDYQTYRDSASVMALRDAGAIIIGKTTTTEFAGSECLRNWTTNPWDYSRTPGGSSSGSAAAVAAGMVAASLGTQVIGSIIRPASYCGVVAFKPSVGGVNRGGSFDYSSQSVQGSLASSLSDAWSVVREITERVGGDPGYRGVAGPLRLPASKAPTTIGVLATEGWHRATVNAKGTFDDTVRKIKSTGVQVFNESNSASIADLEHAINDASSISRQIVGYENVWPFNEYYKHDHLKMSEKLCERLATSKCMSAADYNELLSQRDKARTVYGRLAGNVDVLITLSATGPAPPGFESTGDASFNTAASLVGAPSINLPVFTIDGLPLGLQILGHIDQDRSLFASAAWLFDLLNN